MQQAFPPGRGASGRDARGGALAAVVVMLPVILLSVAAYSNRALVEMELSVRESHRTRALYIAQAGLQKAGRALLDDPTYRGSGYYIPFEGGHYSYKVVGDEVYPELGKQILVTSTGTYTDAAVGQTQKELSVIVKEVGRFVIDHAVASWGRVTLNGGAQIGDSMNTDNSVYSGNTDPATAGVSIYGQGSTWLYGTGEVVTAVTQANLPNLDPGPIEYEVEPLTFPTYDLGPLKIKAMNNTQNPQYPLGTYFTGDMVFNDETLKGVIYAEGEVDVKGTVIVDGGCIVQAADRPFTVNADLTMTSDMNPATGAPNLAILKTGGNAINFSPGGAVNIAGFIFAEDPIIFDSDGVVKGGLVSSNDISLGGNCTVFFEKIEADDLAQEVNLTGEGTLFVVSWLETFTP